MKLRATQVPAMAGIAPDASLLLRLFVHVLDLLVRLFPGLPIPIP